MLLNPPGEVVSVVDLRITKAKAFVEYLNSTGPQNFSVFIEALQLKDHEVEVVVFEVQPERPQHLTHNILRTERLVAAFNKSDAGYPEVLSLRDDFPCVPHLNLTGSEFPRSLCLYDQPYETVRLSWTPALFLQRIHFWLTKTATGNLHGEDQPLEPFVGLSPYQLIVPADFKPLDKPSGSRFLNVYGRLDNPQGSVIFADWISSDNKQPVKSITIAFQAEPQTHGIIRQLPKNLFELHEFCQCAGLDLAKELGESIKTLFLDKTIPAALESRLAIIIVIPKKRSLNSTVESFDTRAFLTKDSLKEIGAALNILDATKGATGYLLGSPTIDAAQLGKIELLGAQVFHALSPESAARMNGCNPNAASFVAIGMGALGSQVINNLTRSGYGQWTLIDNDILAPHNCARHLLNSLAVGWNKSQAVEIATNGIFGNHQATKSIPANIISPGKHHEVVSSAINECSMVMDFSASIAVSRHLASSTSKARHLSAFITPDGNGAVITVEDTKREIRLDWLEMLHYRSVINEPSLKNSLESKDSKIRYGNSCRDISTELAQDSVALWSSMVSKTIHQLATSTGPVIRTFRQHKDLSVNVFDELVTPLTGFAFGKWVIRFDKFVVDKMSNFRGGRLPNETGGILLGAFDTHSKICSIIDVLPSPPDSTEWPTSYIRGCNGLRDDVENIGKTTLGQVGYVGEWHSHPKGASISPSTDDKMAYEWLCAKMHAEALPGIMLIIGDQDRLCLVVSQENSPILDT